MSNLIFIPYPRAEESPTSLVKRTVRKHGSVSCAALFRSVTGSTLLPGSQIAATSTYATMLSRGTHLNPDRVLSGFYALAIRNQTQINYVISGVPVPHYFIRFKPAAFCDYCFNEDKEYQVKDLNFTLHCPYHHRTYLHHCPHCEKALRWQDGIYGDCPHCQGRLTCNDCSPYECRLESELVKILRNHDQLRMQQLDEIVISLGITRRAVLEVRERRTLIEVGFAIMDGNIDEIAAYLNLLRTRHPDVDKRWISQKLALINSPAVKKAVSLFMKHPAPPAPPSTINSSFELSGAQILKILKISNHLLIQLRRKLKIQKSAKLSISEIEKIEQIVQSIQPPGLPLPVERSKMWGLGRTCRELRVPPQALSAYINNNLITAYTGTQTRQVFYPPEITAFKSKYVPLPTLMRDLGVSFSLIMQELDELMIPIHRLPGHDLRYSLLSARDARSAHKKITFSMQYSKKIKVTNKGLEDLPDHLSIEQAADKLKLPPQIVVQLVYAGILEGSYSSPNHAIIIHKEEIRQNTEKFITTTQFAELLNIPTESTRKLLDRIHALPVRSHGAPRTYYRQDATPLINEFHTFNREKADLIYPTTAAKEIGISLAQFKSLVACGLLNPVLSSTQQYFSRRKITKFRTRFISLRDIKLNYTNGDFGTSTISAALARNGVKPLKLTDSTFNSGIYEISAVKKSFTPNSPALLYFNSIQLQKKRVKTRQAPASHVPLYSLIAPYKISAAALHGIFVNSGFITTINVNYELYISEQDHKKCKKILDKYCTLHMGAELYSVSYGKLTRLINSGSIQVVHPIANTRWQLLKRQDIIKYL